MDDIETLKRILNRERAARKQAEQIIEDKSRELFKLNEQLKELNASLEGQVEERTLELERKVEELRNSNKYKSEFLANMSHELRTPLNSILILARMLRDNKENNFTPKQIEYASVILNSGKDLLALINDILDLAKIESGRVEVLIEETSILEIKNDLENMFEGMSNEKMVKFNVDLSPKFPAFIVTDKTKILQILRNLLSNAFKFTEKGGQVNLEIEEENAWMLMTVKDNGIGIEEEKIAMVFEAFRQADGSTSRRYGGTGLGLSICRELVALLGGEISLESKLGEGSTFKVKIPMNLTLKKKLMEDVNFVSKMGPQNQSFIKEKANLKITSKQPILIVEDDPRFVIVLKDYAEEHGLNVVVAGQGDTGLFFAKKFNPIAILLDIQLPVMNGLQVLEELKADPELANIPVHIFSIMDKSKLGLKMGAETYNVKPINIQNLEDIFNRILDSRKSSMKECMILGKNSKLFPKFYQGFQNYFSNVRFASNYRIALDVIRKNEFGAIMIVDNDLNGMDFDDFARELALLYETKKEILKIFMPPKKSSVIQELSKGHNIDFIFDEKVLKNDFGIDFQDEQGENKKIEEITTHFLKGMKILLVEDEMRNVFVLDSLLEPNGAIITVANNGKEALNKLEEDPEFDIVLMDIMMPIMNGYDAIKHIRENPKTADLKIVAVTAKAMIGDAEKCLEAGADAYVCKPIDVDLLFATMKEMTA